MREAMGVGGEMRRHPVEDDADALAVAGIDEAGKILGPAEARRRRELRQRLVAPGAPKGMLHDRQELDMGEAHLGDIGDQPFGQAAPVECTIAFPLGLHPGSGMDLVDRDRRIVGVVARALLHPVGIMPLEVRSPCHDGGRCRWRFGLPRHRIGFLQHAAVAADDLELVACTRSQPRHEQFPDTGLVAQPHRMADGLQVVESLHDRGPDALGRQTEKAHPSTSSMVGWLAPRWRVRVNDLRTDGVEIAQPERAVYSIPERAPGQYDAKQMGRSSNDAGEEAGAPPGRLSRFLRLSRAAA